MLDLTRTRIYESEELPLNSYASQFEDGTALNGTFNADGKMSAYVNGTPTNTDICLGVAMTTFTTPTYNVSVAEYTIPSASPYTLTLPFTPIAGTIQVYFTSNNTSLTSETTAAAVIATGEYNLTGATMTFFSADAGKTVMVVYKYSLTVVQAQALVGTGVPGGTWPSNVTGSIGVIQRGLVYTSMYDTSVNWATATTAKVANGMFIASSGTGASLASNCYIAQIPTVASPFLGVAIRA